MQGPDGSVYYADLINGVIGRLDITNSTTPVGTPVTLAVGSGPDALVLKISQDAFQGSALYTVSVDGVQIGGTLTAGASHAAGQDDTVSVLGNFAPGPHRLTVNFLNDLYNGTPDTDRNLYVDGITYDSATVPNGTAALMSAGPLDFAFTDSGVGLDAKEYDNRQRSRFPGAEDQPGRLPGQRAVHGQRRWQADRWRTHRIGAARVGRRTIRPR